MATIKSYSDLKQSKVLSKILSDDSADMVYIASANDDIGDTLYTAEYKSEIIIKEGDTDYINCWSLAALLSVLPHIQEFYPTLEKINDKYVCRYKESGIWTNGDNPVDACYWMILKLNELKML
jgi:hypothetical protein